jgi:N-acetylmuramoyl-L-alanine amidase
MGSRKRPLVDSVAGVYHYNDLAVLMLTTMPAVLLEAGSIVHRGEEQILASQERQKLVATAVTEAVEQFCKLPHAVAPPDPMATSRIE